MFFKKAAITVAMISLLISAITVSANVETSPEVSPYETQIAEARKALPKECLIETLVEALEKGISKCEISKERKAVFVSFPIITDWAVVTQSVSFSERKGFSLGEKETSSEPARNLILTFFWLCVPALGMLIVSILNASNRGKRVYLLVFYGIFFGSVYIGGIAGGMFGEFPGAIAGAFTGGLAGAFAGGLAAGLAGAFAGAFAGLAAEIAGAFTGGLGWKSAGITEYLIFFATICIISFVIREIIAALLARRAR